MVKCGAFSPSGGKLGLKMAACFRISSCNATCLVNKGLIDLFISSLVGIYCSTEILRELVLVLNASFT